MEMACRTAAAFLAKFCAAVGIYCGSTFIRTAHRQSNYAKIFRTFSPILCALLKNEL